MYSRSLLRLYSSSANAAVKQTHSKSIAVSYPRNNKHKNDKVITYFDIRNPVDFHHPSTILEKPRINSQIDILAQTTKDSILQGLRIYAKLSKMRLATLVVCTTMAGYSISPFVCTVASPIQILTATSVGTSLCITSANTINQLMEIEHDAKMARTRARVLPSGKVGIRTAWSVGAISGALGTLILYYGVNPMTAYLGLSNIFLYTAIYTPMKRMSVYNTHVGSVVGAIPPLMGWTALNGGEIIGGSYGGVLLAAVLFAWQFPHFNALSHSIRHEYLKAGYKMMANVNPEKNAAISLRWSAALFPICYGLVADGVTTEWFLLTSSLPNAYMLYYAYRFWNDGDKGRDKNAKKLFMASLFHLPAIVILMLLHKKHWLSQTHKQELDLIINK